MKATSKSLRGNLTPAEVRNTIHQICAKHNYDPFEELVKLAVGTHNVSINGEMMELPLCDIEQRITIAKELAPYLAPKLKNIEVKQEMTGGFHITLKRFGADEKVITDSPEALENAKQLLEKVTTASLDIPIT
jgi:hypothetical protein